MRSRDNTYEWTQATYSFCPGACKKRIKCALPKAKAREWQSREVTVDNSYFTRFMAADTHTHTNHNHHVCTHKAQNSMYVGNGHVSLCQQYGAWKPKCTILHFLFCVCMLATMNWASVTVLVHWRGQNNVGRILWCAKTVGQKRRRTWWLHLHVHIHATLVKETLRSI